MVFQLFEVAQWNRLARHLWTGVPDTWTPRCWSKCVLSGCKALPDKSKALVAIDGKSLRGSRNGKQSPLHIVSAWACQASMLLGQVQTGKKSNEITAIPELLKLLSLKGCIVTIDAMGCQKAIPQSHSIDSEADYVLQPQVQPSLSAPTGRLVISKKS